MAGLLAGETAFTFSTLPQAVPLVQEGQLRALAVSTPQRLANLPEVPTVAEQGFPGYAYAEFLGLHAPAGTPAAVQEQVWQAAAEAMRQPEVLARLGQIGMLPAPLGPAEFQRFIAEYRAFLRARIADGSLKREDFPRYVENGRESARGLHAIRVLQDKKDFTLEGLLAAAYDSYLTWFDKPLPALLKAWDAVPTGDPLKVQLADQVGILRAWDQRWAVGSVATSLGVFWAEQMTRTISGEARQAGMSNEEYLAGKASGSQLLQGLALASEKLTADFGTWRTPWGDINRFQRLTGDIVQPFNDVGPSIPVGFTSAVWGSLASFGARAYPGTKKWYGTSGNSFVAVVEFGDKVRAVAVSAGGESGDPRSKHFNDQAARYAGGQLREVYFYPSQLKGHVEREYRPGK
jgi:acyl-homoserine lactone acylase PvdQ